MRPPARSLLISMFTLNENKGDKRGQARGLRLLLPSNNKSRRSISSLPPPSPSLPPLHRAASMQMAVISADGGPPAGSRLMRGRSRRHLSPPGPIEPQWPSTIARIAQSNTNIDRFVIECHHFFHFLWFSFICLFWVFDW